MACPQGIGTSNVQFLLAVQETVQGANRFYGHMPHSQCFKNYINLFQILPKLFLEC